MNLKHRPIRNTITVKDSAKIYAEIAEMQLKQLNELREALQIRDNVLPALIEAGRTWSGWRTQNNKYSRAFSTFLYGDDADLHYYCSPSDGIKDFIPIIEHIEALGLKYARCVDQPVNHTRNFHFYKNTFRLELSIHFISSRSCQVVEKVIVKEIKEQKIVCN